MRRGAVPPLLLLQLVGVVPRAAGVGPVPEPTTSYWMDYAGVPYQDTRSTAELPTRADVVVIGAGIAGTRAADGLTRRGVETLLIDARGVSAGATGRNAGMITAGVSWAAVAREHGDERARALAALADDQFAAMVGFVRDACDPSIDCWQQVEGRANLYMDGDTFAAQASSARAQQDAAAGRNLTVLESSACKAELGASVCAGAVKNANSGNVWPNRVAFGLVHRALSTGLLNLQTRTRVTALHGPLHGPRHRSDRWEVHTDRGVVRCRDVVLATNAYTGDLLPEFRGVIVPQRAQAIATAPQPLQWEGARARSVDAGDMYGHQRPNGVIIWGGMRRVTKGEEEGVTDDSRVDPLIAGGLRAALPAYFPGTADALAVTHEWTGIMGAATGGAWAGPLTATERAGVFICSGFTGGGMSPSTGGWALCDAVAEMVATGQPPLWWRDFAWHYDRHLPASHHYDGSNWTAGVPNLL